MADARRKYRAPVREEQARLTRDRIIRTAGESFASAGWAGTTVAHVARAASVTPQTVHMTVGSKPALLIEAVRSAVAGDAGEVPLAQRQPFATAYAARGTVRERAEAFAAGCCEVYERAGALFLVLAQAAPLDDALAARWEIARQSRLSDCRRLLRVSGHGTGSARRTADLVFVQSGPGVHAELVIVRGWSARSYRAWLADTLEFLLGARRRS
jgi:AcrR family transcriptional regulator